MEEQNDPEEISKINIIAVLPNNERKIYSVNRDATVENFINQLEEGSEISHSNSEKMYLIYSGKILKEYDKFSNITSSNQILVYIILNEPNLTSLEEHNIENNQDGFTYNYDDMPTIEFQEFNMRRIALSPFISRQILLALIRQNNRARQNIVRNINNEIIEERREFTITLLCNFLLICLYFFVGLELGFLAILILIAQCFFGGSRPFIVIPTFAGIFTHYILKLVVFIFKTFKHLFKI